jgi:hypothetical protein
VVSDGQAAALRRFADRGGNLFVCGDAGIFDAGGEERNFSAFESLLDLRFGAAAGGGQEEADWENPVLHNYLRIEATDSPVFAGIEHTSLLPMGGKVKEIVPGGDLKVLATYIPPFPIYPPEFAWTTTLKTGRPVLTEYAFPQGGGKAIYAAWDLDAVYGRAALPDHGDLIANIVLYLLGDRIPLRVTCGAYIDFKVYRQENRLIIHLINSNHSGFVQGYAEKNLPVGPVEITLRLPDFSFSKAWATEDNQQPEVSRHPDGACSLRLERLGVHQLIVLD